MYTGAKRLLAYYVYIQVIVLLTSFSIMDNDFINCDSYMKLQPQFYYVVIIEFAKKDHTRQRECILYSHCDYISARGDNYYDIAKIHLYYYNIQSSHDSAAPTVITDKLV